MPNLAQAKKALRQSAKRAERNQVIREELHSMRRHFRKALEAGKVDEAKKLIPTIQKKLDKAVTKGVQKKNTSARILSRLAASIKRSEAKK